eukprot:GHVU01097814.1.p2 GENE.GHVU01097814.1~~GHVU01097814.1.p2  ORF type:complete len:192 (+),score=26.51 GHVU01097814.1:206-781(+)
MDEFSWRPRVMTLLPESGMDSPLFSLTSRSGVPEYVMPPELRRIAGPDKEWLLDMHLGEAVFMARTMGLVEEEKARERFAVGGGRRDDGVEGNGNDCDDSTAPTPATGPVPSRPFNGDECERIASPFRRHADLGGLRLHLTVAPREGLGAVRRWEGTLQVKNISGFEPVTPEDQLALVRLLKVCLCVGVSV